MRCNMTYQTLTAVMLSMILGLSMPVSMTFAGQSAEAKQIDREADAALKKLLEDTPEAETFRKEAKGILVFPSIVKDGIDPFAVEGIDNFPYAVPNLKFTYVMHDTGVTPGYWRAVSHNLNAVALECFIDELANAAGQDPLAFRRKLMTKHPKHLAVLNAVAEKVGWDKPAPQGIYRGLAQQMGYGSYVAAAAEISVTGGNKIKIHRIVAATDCGHAVNPAQIERQVAGSFVYGLSALFYGECTVKDGRIEQTNFDTYNSMRIAEMPKVECVMVPSGGFWGGVGEPTICVAPPAVLNAIAAATGTRYRTFPLRDHGLSMA